MMRSLALSVALIALIACVAAVPSSSLRDELERDLHALEHDLHATRQSAHETAANTEEEAGAADAFAATEAQVGAPAIAGANHELCDDGNSQLRLRVDQLTNQKSGYTGYEYSWNGNAYVTRAGALNGGANGHSAFNLVIPNPGMGAVNPSTLDVRLLHAGLPNGSENAARINVAIAQNVYALNTAGNTESCDGTITVRWSARCGNTNINARVKVVDHATGAVVAWERDVAGAGNQALTIASPANGANEIAPGMYDFEIWTRAPAAARQSREQGRGNNGIRVGHVGVGGQDRTTAQMRTWLHTHHTRANILQAWQATHLCQNVGASSLSMAVTTCNNAATEPQQPNVNEVNMAISGADNQGHPDWILRRNAVGQAADYSHYPVSAAVNWADGHRQNFPGGDCANGKPVDGDMVIWGATLEQKAACEVNAGAVFTATYFIDRPFCDCCAHFFRHSDAGFGQGPVLDDHGIKNPHAAFNWLTFYVGTEAATRFGAGNNNGNPVRATDGQGANGFPATNQNLFGGVLG